MADNAGSRRLPGKPGRVSRDGHSFAVEAWVGRKVTGWPLGRFDIETDGLRVRLSFPWFIARSADKDTITSVSVRKSIAGLWCARFEDSQERLGDVHVHLVTRAQRVIDELHQRGYAVVDPKTGEQLVRLPKR